MFATGNRPQARRGKPITARQINAGDKLLTQLSRLRGGRGTLWAPFGPGIAQPGTNFRIGMTGDDGIPAAAQADGESSGTIQLGYSDEISDCWIQVTQPGQAVVMISDASANFEGYNLSSNDVQPNTFTMYMMLWSVWVCVWEDCPAGD